MKNRYKNNYNGIFDKYRKTIYDNMYEDTFETAWSQVNKEKTIGDIIDEFGAENLIEAIGLDKVEEYLRKKKLKKLKSKLR